MAIVGGLFLSIWAYLTPDFVSATNGWVYGLRGPLARTFSALSIVFGAFTLETLRRNLQYRDHNETLWTMATWSAYFASLCQVSAVFAVFNSRTCAHGCFMVSLGLFSTDYLDHACTKNPSVSGLLVCGHRGSSLAAICFRAEEISSSFRGYKGG